MTHEYLSTACLHGEHAACRLRCKFCDVPCLCSCHAAWAGQNPDLPEEDT